MTGRVKHVKTSSTLSRLFLTSSDSLKWRMQVGRVVTVRLSSPSDITHDIFMKRTEGRSALKISRSRSRNIIFTGGVSLSFLSFLYLYFLFFLGHWTRYVVWYKNWYKKDKKDKKDKHLYKKDKNKNKKEI